MAPYSSVPLFWAVLLATNLVALGVAAQTDGDGPDRPGAADATDDSSPDTAERVYVESRTQDAQIQRRLERIMSATGWFQSLQVRVDEGVVFIEATTGEERYREWAGNLARRTEGVVAVVNRIALSRRSLTDFGPAWEGLRALWDNLLRSTPLLLLGMVLAGSAYFAGRGMTWAIRSGLRRRGRNDVVRDIAARAAGLILFTLGVYLALRVAGLTRLAATVLGGTGVAGIVLGIAFRDIAENVLASILLTRQQPFRRGDLVEIQGIEGFVQRLTVRATVLMTLDGNHVQIPNSTIYKNPIRNFTSNPARRIDFIVGIGYADSIADAQEVALSVITQHPAVLRSPEPWVLAEALGSAAVQLRVYVWLDGTRYSWLKVRSSMIRLVKRAFQQRGISMPDEAREVVFPEQVPVVLLDARAPQEAEHAPQPRGTRAPTTAECDTVATHAEAGLDTDSGSIGRMSDEARSPEAGRDLLADPGSSHRAVSRGD